MLQHLPFRTKLIMAFLLVGLTPLIIVSIIALNTSSASLKESAFNQLDAIMAVKKNQIEGYFEERYGDVVVLSNNPDVISAMIDFEKAFMDDGSTTGGSEWSAMKQRYGGWLTEFKEKYGYYDLFLIAGDGDVVYSVAEESDLGQNLVSGSLKNSSLGRCFHKIAGSVAFGDFEPYAPSNGEPASFIGTPVVKDGRKIGVVALQISTDGINHIMKERTGMGETGETYLIGQDKLMRSDSYLDPTNHSIIASFKDPSKGSVNTEAADEALAGKTGHKIIIDYNGNPVLSAYAPLKVGDATWAILAEIDKAEAFAPVNALVTMIMIIAIVGILGIIVAAVLFAGSVEKPIRKIFAGLKSLSNRELADTTGTFRTIIDNLSTGADQVSSASGQLSSSSQSMSEGASEQASSLEEISSSLEEMASMTKQNSENASQADVHSKESVEAMTHLENAMKGIKTSSDETAKIVKTIDEIAMQTNLLALNAAVEAARAGEAGKGFAVVAEEVRSLAQRAAEAAKETAGRIDESQKNAESGVSYTGRVQESLNKVSQVISEVSAASREQSQGIDQVNTAVAQMDKVTQQNAANAEESASASEELSGQAQNLNAMVAELSAIVVGGGGGTIRQSSIARPAAAQRKTAMAFTGIEDRRRSVNKLPPPSTAGRNEVRPEQVISFHDDASDLADF